MVVSKKHIQKILKSSLIGIDNQKIKYWLKISWPISKPDINKSRYGDIGSCDHKFEKFTLWT